VSGRGPRVLVSASDPCEKRINSGTQNAGGLIIDGANPDDFAQFTIVADPLDYACDGEEIPLNLNGVNLSTTGGVSSMTTACFFLPGELVYSPGSLSFTAPAGFVPNNITEIIDPNTGQVEVCADVPDGIGPQQFFGLQLLVTPSDTASCGELLIGNDIKSLIPDVTCTTTGEVCDIFVDNTVNAEIPINIVPPVGISNIDLVVQCDEDPNTATYDYTLELEGLGGNFFGNVTVDFVKDIDQNGQIDSYDNILATDVFSANVPNGSVVNQGGTVMIPEALSCPILIRANFDVACGCTEIVVPFDTAPTPDFLVNLSDPVTLCPGATLDLEICSGWEFTVEPSDGATFTESGSTLSIDVNDNYVDVPVTISATSQIGNCPADFSFDLIEQGSFEIGPYDLVELCDSECNTLDLELPAEWDGNVTITWTPATYLDDPTSATPEICYPAADIVYTVEVYNPNQGCTATAQYPVSVIPTSPPTLELNGSENCYLPYAPSTIDAAPAGAVDYKFYQIINGQEVLVQSGANNSYTLTSGTGDYIVRVDDGECVTTSSPLSLDIMECIFDMALAKTLNPSQVTPVYAGDIVTFDITVTNQGTINAQDVIVYDYIPVGMQLADIGWNDLGNNTASQTIAGPILPGQAVTISIMLEVLPGATAGDLTNYAEIESADDEFGEGYPDVDSTPDGDNTNDTGGTPGDPNEDDNIDDDGTVDEDDHDPAQVPVEIFDLALTKVINTTATALPVSIGDDVTYTIEVCNQGTVDAFNVEVVDYMPAELTLNDPDWTLDANGNAYITEPGPIAAGACVQIDLTCTISVLPANGVIDNYAEISEAEDANGNNPPDIDSDPDDDPSNDGPVTDDVNDGSNGDEDDHDPASLPVEEFDLALVKTIASPGPYAPGSTITFDITVSNQGNVDAFNVGVVDYVPTGLIPQDANWTYAIPVATLNTNIPTIPVGGSVTVQITMTIDATFMGTSITNFAEISEADNDMDPNNDPPTDIDSDPDADDSNDGPYEDNDTDNTNGDEDDHDPETILIEQTFDLALTKVINTTLTTFPVAVGDDVTYTVEVCNQGTVDGYNVQVVDYMPAELTLNDPDWALDANGNAFITIPGPIAAGSCEQVDLTCTITTLPADGQVDNFAEIADAEDEDGNHPTDVDSTPDDDDSNDGPVTDDVTDGSNGDEDDHDPASFPVEEFDLALVKTLSSPGPFNPGDPVTFTITIINQGNVDAYNIGVVDYVPTGLIPQDADWTYAIPTATLNTPIGFLAAGTSTSVDIDMVIDVNFMGTSITNYAEISEADDDTDPNNDPPTDIDSEPDADDSNDGPADDNVTDGSNGDEDDHDPETIPIGQTFDLALTKVLSAAQTYPIYVGDDVTYTIEVCNQGTVDAYNVDVVDYMPAELTLNDPDWSLDANGNAYITIAGPIAAGSCTTVDLTCTLVTNPASGSVDNFAEIADAEDADGNHPDDFDSTPDDDPNNDGPVTDDDTDNTNGDEDDHDPASFPVGEFDLALTKVLSTPPAYTPGQTVTYTITIINQGTVDAYNIGVVDYVPTGLIPSDPDWTYVIPTATLNTPIPFLAAGTSTTVDIEMIIDPAFQGTSLVNYSEISEADDDMDPNNDPPTDVDSTPDADGSNDGPSEDNDTDNTNGDEDDHDPAELILEQTFDLALTKVISPAQAFPVSLGDDVTFTIEVCNQGTIDAYNVDVVDYLPADLTLNDPDWILDANGNPFITLAGPITPGACEAVDLTATIVNLPASGVIENFSEIADAEDEDGNHPPDEDSTPDDDPGNDGPVTDNDTDNTDGDEDDHDPASFPVEIFDLALDKAISSTQALPVEPGDNVTFTITVINQGNVDAYSIDLGDNIPAGLILNDTDWTDVGGVADLNVPIAGPLAPGATASVDITMMMVIKVKMMKIQKLYLLVKLSI